MRALYDHLVTCLAPINPLACLTFLSVTQVAHAGVQPFTEEAIARGLIYQMQDYPQQYGYLGFGCGFADLDGDGDQDAIVIGASNAQVGIFENNGAGLFTDRSGITGIGPLPAGSSFAAGDYDGDELIDLYLSQTALPDGTPLTNRLLRNVGGFQFMDVTFAAGVGDLGDSKSASWGDFDGDGFLDLYVCNYSGIVGGENTANITNKLFRNRGDGTFEDVSNAQGVDDDGFGFQSVWFDFDRDGDVDLYLSNDRANSLAGHENQLWRNDNGTLVNVSAGSGADVAIDSMGIACGDFDGNRWPDLYLTNIPGTGGHNNPLLLNQGDGTFTLPGFDAGVDNEAHWRSWGSIFFDVDNDGYLDLYVNNELFPNTLYTHAGTFPCTDVADEFALQGSASGSFSSAVADIDGDGDQDLLQNNVGGFVELFINHEGAQRNWIRYHLVGRWPNHQAIGASVDTRTGTQWQLREVLAGGNSYLAQHELTVHVGLGDASQADEVVVRWPGGVTQTLYSLAANQVHTILEPNTAVPAVSQWGLIVAVFLLLACASITYRRVHLPS